MILFQKRDDFHPLFRSVGCICTYQSKILLLKRKEGKSFPFKWGIPTGKIHTNETVKKAVVRELFEETHILCSAENLKFIDSFQIENDNMNFIYDLFVLELSYEPQIIINEDEHTEYQWVKFIDLDKYALVPDVKETVAIGLNKKKKCVQLNLFTGLPEDENNDLSIFEQQEEFNISHGNFKENLNFGKKWYVSYGAPGVGKTSTLDYLEKHFSDIVLEKRDVLKKSLNFKEFLEKAFIEKEHKFFFHFQMEILQLRFWQSYYAGNNAIVDEGIFSPLAYTKALLSLKWIDKYVFDSFFRNYSSYQAILTPPYKILYFYSSTETLVSRIRRRKRPHERYYSEQYIEALNEAFSETAAYLKKVGFDIYYINTDNKPVEQIAEGIWQNILKDNI